MSVSTEPGFGLGVLRGLGCAEEACRQRHVTWVEESKEQIYICEGFMPLDLSFWSSSDLVNIRDGNNPFS